MASRPPRFERQIQAQAPAIDPMAGAAQEHIAAELERFVTRRAEGWVAQREDEAFAQGQQAALEGGVADRAEWNRVNRAFNRGVLVAQQAALQTDVRDSIARFHLDHPNDPDAFAARVDGLREGLAGEVDPRLRPFVEDRIRDYAGRAQIRIIAQQQSELRQQAVEDLDRGARGLVEDATTAAYEGDIPLLEARRQELQGLLREAIQGGLLNEAEAVETLDGFEQAVIQQEVVGNFERLVREVGPEASVTAIRNWQQSTPSDLGITPAQHDAVTRQLIGLKNREAGLLADQRAREAAELAAERKLREGRVKDAIGVMQRGFAPDKGQLETVAGDLDWLMEHESGPALAHQLDIAATIQEQVHRFRRLPDPQRSQELNRLEGALRGQGASVESLALLDALQKTHADVARQLDQDARGYVIREGLIADAPLDFSDPEKLIASFEARATGSEIGRELTGQVLPRLTADEADQLADLYDGLEVEEKVAVLGTVTAGAGEDAQATLAQMAQQGYQGMALLGEYVMEGRGRLARDILRGQAVLATTPIIKPKPTDWSADVESAWGTAMFDWPEQRAVYQEAAFARYAELKRVNGDLSEAYDSNLMVRALEEVMPTARFNGRRVAIPASLTERDFRQWTRSWEPEQFADIAGSEGQDMLKLVNRRGRLVEVGHGRYGVMLYSAVDGREKPLVRTDGEIFTLEIPRGPAP